MLVKATFDVEPELEDPDAAELEAEPDFVVEELLLPPHPAIATASAHPVTNVSDRRLRVMLLSSSGLCARETSACSVLSSAIRLGAGQLQATALTFDRVYDRLRVDARIAPLWELGATHSRALAARLLTKTDQEVRHGVAKLVRPPIR
jgi:hypothetical protein